MLVQRIDKGVVAFTDELDAGRQRIPFGRQSLYLVDALLALLEVVLERVGREVRCKTQFRHATDAFEVIHRQLLARDQHVVGDLAVEILERVAWTATGIAIRTRVRRGLVHLGEPRAAGCIPDRELELQRHAVRLENPPRDHDIERVFLHRHNPHLPPVTGALERAAQAHRHVARFCLAHVREDLLLFLVLFVGRDIGIEQLHTHVE